MTDRGLENIYVYLCICFISHIIYFIYSHGEEGEMGHGIVNIHDYSCIHLFILYFILFVVIFAIYSLFFIYCLPVSYDYLPLITHLDTFNYQWRRFIYLLRLIVYL